MKNIAKVLLLIFAISIFITACAPPPPRVTKDQLVISEQEASKAVEEANMLKKEKAKLEEEKAQKERDLRSLKIYKQELEAESGN